MPIRPLLTQAFLLCGLLWLGGVFVSAQSTKNSSSTVRTEAKPASSDTPLPGSGNRANDPAPDAPIPAAASAPAKPVDEAASGPGTLVRWYGHAFIYLTNSTGVRIAIDPFNRGTVKYLFPGRLPADTVLISSEADDHAAGEQLFGTPQIFRSYTAIGVNKANGMIFTGVSVNRDNRGGPNPNKCTAFTFSLDGVNFAHLGVVGSLLDARQRRELGRVDVLFLPIGNPLLTVADLNKIAADVQAKIIVPITYRTDFTPGMNLRSLDDYLRDQKLPIKRLDKSEFVINSNLLPTQPTIYVPALP